MKKVILGSALIFAFVSVVGFTPSAEAKKKNSDHKVTICHRTNAVNNPYRKITVDQSAVDGQGKNDHTHHTGPVATSQAVAQNMKNNKQKWGDIIPNTLNWTSQGQAVYNNGCKYVTPETPENPRTPLTPQGTTSEEEAGPQVQAPASGVNAGSGDATTAAVAAVTLIGSVASLAYGVRRFTKFGA